MALAHINATHKISIKINRFQQAHTNKHITNIETRKESEREREREIETHTHTYLAAYFNKRTQQQKRPTTRKRKKKRTHDTH